MVDRLSRPGVDLVLQLADTNASRPCADSDCDQAATHYVFTDGVVSVYVCDHHLDRAVESAQA
jgi:hypothetical protein